MAQGKFILHDIYIGNGRSYEAVIPPRVHPLDLERGRDLYLVLALAGNRAFWESLQLYLFYLGSLAYPREDRRFESLTGNLT